MVCLNLSQWNEWFEARCLGNRIINTAELVVPHPRIAERDFVLFPLRDIDPNMPLATGETVEQACERVSSVARDMKRHCPRRVVSCGGKGEFFTLCILLF